MLNKLRSTMGGGYKPMPMAEPAASPSPSLLWYPKANSDQRLATSGKYALGYPQGAVVHYTAGRPGLAALDEARKNGFTYFLIDEGARVYQGFPLDRWGPHAGVSSWKGLKGGVSRSLVGIEVISAGLVTPDGRGNFKTWWGDLVQDVRVVEAKANRKAGAYHIFSDAQEDALVELLLWLKANNPTVFSLDIVLGHDEVAPKRKSDPGGSLSLTMPAFRQLLTARYQAAARPQHLLKQTT